MKINNSLLSKYSTQSLSLAAAISLFLPIKEIDKSNPHKAIFIFEKDPKLEKLIESYWKNELKVSASEYFNQLRNIKTRLYGGE